MSFELLVLPAVWFLDETRNEEEQFGSLTKLINKSYSKPALKYNIIQTTRVKSPKSFLEDFSIRKQNGNFTLFLLLAPEKSISKIRHKYQFYRDFEKPTSTEKEAFSCDIPEEYLEELNFTRDSNLEIKVAKKGDVINDDILQRTIGTVGLRNEKKKVTKSLDLELTCVTSFMRYAASTMLSKIEDILLDEPILLMMVKEGSGPIQAIILHAEVIVEHKLVDYYILRCGFEKSLRNDVLVKVMGTGSLQACPLEEGIRATRDFHLAYLRKTIEYNY